jgi:uncharacterized protein (DUF486 family)
MPGLLSSTIVRTTVLLVCSNVLGVFVPFAVLYMRQPLRWDYLWAGLCIIGAIYFMFRGGTTV